MKKLFYILIGIVITLAGTVWALPYYQQTQSMIPGSDTVNNDIGTTSPSNRRYNAFLKNVTLGTTTSGCVQSSATGVLFVTGTACGTGSGGSASIEYNPFTAASFVATSTATSTLSAGLEAPKISAQYFHATSTTASSTFNGGVNINGGNKIAWTNTAGVGNLYITGSNIGDLELGATAAGTITFKADIADFTQTTLNFSTIVNNLTPSSNNNFTIGSPGTSWLSSSITNASSTNLLSTNISANFASTSNSAFLATLGGSVGIGTSTTPSVWIFQVNGTRPLSILSDSSAGADLKHWYMSSQGGNFYIGTSSDAYATSTQALLTMDKTSKIFLGNNALVIDTLTGSTTSSNLSVGNLNMDSDAGNISWIDLPVQSATNNTEQSYTAQIGGINMLTIYGKSTGNGAIKNTGIGIGSTSPFCLLCIQNNGNNFDSFTGRNASTTNFEIFVASTTPSATTTHMVLTNTGYLGLGTTTPAAVITSYTSVASSTNLLLEAVSGGGCLIVQDVQGGGYTEIYTQAGSVYGKVTTSLNTCN